MTAPNLRRMWTRFGTGELRSKLARYTAGSVVAFGTSEIAFVALFAPHLLGAKGSSIAASLIGIIPGYYLNRNWAWGRRGRSHPWREVAPYWATVLISTLAAALAIGAVNDAASDWSRAERTVVNAGTYMAVYGVLFVAKFVLFNSVLWKDRTPDREPELV